MLTALVWPTAALLAAVGLRALAPRRAPGLYLAPALCTLAVLTLAATYIAAVWST
jgi:hypothetical protein